MDIHGASRALWSAYDKIAERRRSRFSREGSEQDLSAYTQLRDGSALEQPAPELWNEEHQNPIFALGNRDTGHFSEEEFLRQFGGTLS